MVMRKAEQRRDCVMKHPMQPIEEDKNGVLRFKPNAIIDYLFKQGLIDLNAIATMNFSKEDRQQLAQLLGYSLDGYSSLNYVTDQDYATAITMSEEPLSEDKARIQVLENMLSSLRDSLRQPMADLFGIHPEDLTNNDD